MIGYAPNGYRLWDEDQRKIYIYRDVIFNEKKDNFARQEFEDEEKSEEKEEIVERNGMEEEKAEIEEIEQNEEAEENKSQARRSTRQRRVPEKLKKDYVFDYFAMLTYEEATNGPEKEKWKIAIEEEKESLEKNETWKVVNESEAKDKKVLSSKWIFKIKEDQKYKARLVVRGFEQEQGIDYQETFSPVINNSSLKVIFALATVNKYEMYGFDIKTAFLYGELDEDIYMKLPEGYNEEKNKICKLQKALYGLKQAPLKWNKKFSNVLKEAGMISIESERCIYKSENGEIILGIYVDDGIVIGKTKKQLESLIQKLKENFEVKEKYNPTSFLGMEIERNEDGLKLKQEKYASSILQRFNMSEANPTPTPMIFSNCNEAEADESGYPYREAVGSLLYLANKTRPDISYAVSYESRSLNEPSSQDIANVKRTMRYLKGNLNDCVMYKTASNSKKLVAYSDADYAGDLKTRRSTTGYIIFYAGGPVAWCSKKQPIVALSSTEAEFIAAADCVKEILYLKTLIEELTSEEIEVELNVDNVSAITLIKNGVMNKRSKHIDVRYFYIHEKVNDGIIKICHCPTQQQLADCLTKPLNKEKFDTFKKCILH